MSTKRIQTYLEETFSHYTETVSEISDHNLSSEKIMYNFDKISKVVTTKPGFHSADALHVCLRIVEFIEFKTGFTRRITKYNWNPKLATCPDDDEKECLPYKEARLCIADLETQELLDSIKSKAAETYVTWEKCILPKVTMEHRVPLKYVVVIDANKADGIESILGDLAKKTVKTGNQVTSVKQALQRFQGCFDANNTPYYYDSIEVLTFRDYQHRLNS